MKGGMALLEPHLKACGVKPIGTVVLGTVKGDLHDIGKNLVGMMLQGRGLQVVDVGIDVSPDKFVAAFGQPAFVVDVAGGRDCYWESGEQSPVEALFPDEFARRYPVSDFRLLPFCLIASFQKEQVEMVYVARSYEPPASRIGFAGESLRALKRDELLQELEPPDRTAQVGLRQEETEYSWQLSAGQNPLSALPWDYELALACDRFGRVASVRVTRSS